MLLLRQWAAAARAQLVVFALALRARLVDDVRRAWRYWSLQLTAAAVSLQTLVLAAPDVALQAWTGLPAELKALLPVHYVNIVAAALTGAAMLARIWKQKAPANG